MKEISINDIQGFKVGNTQNLEAATGCTVIICDNGAVCGVDVRGGSPGTRDTDALNPINNREKVHAILLSGGSSFGLDAAGGVMKFLEKRKIGRDVAVTVVPNVSLQAKVRSTPQRLGKTSNSGLIRFDISTTKPSCSETSSSKEFR